MAYDDGITNAPISIYDVQRALGTNEQDLGSLCKHANINPMAKYKPVRYSKLSPLTDAEFKSTNYGLVTGSVFNASDSNPSNTWTYNKPTGGSSQPYRLTDFDGYDNFVCPPFAFEVSGELASSVGLSFYINSVAKEVYTGMRWTPDTGITFSDLLAVDGRYLCVAIHDLDKTGSCVVILNKNVASIGQYVSTIVLYAEQQTISGMTYPAVPLLNDRSRSGHNFRFIVGMRNNNDGQSNSQAYKVLETSAVSGLTSLAMIEGIDRKTIRLDVLDTIANLQFSLIDKPTTTLAFTYVGEVTRNGGKWLKYTLSGDVYGKYVTPSNKWAAGSVSVDVYLSAAGGYVDPIDNGTSLTGQDHVWSKAISIPLAGHTYNNVNLANMSSVPIYIYKGAEVSVQVRAKTRYIYEELYAENTLTIRL